MVEQIIGKEDMVVVEDNFEKKGERRKWKMMAKRKTAAMVVIDVQREK